jgi:Helix-turn-helix domain
MKKPPLLNPEQAARVLQMDQRTLVYWARRGYVPAHPMGEGKRKMWRFVESELVEWVKGQCNGSPSRPPEATMEAAIGAHARRIA